MRFQSFSTSVGKVLAGFLMEIGPVYFRSSHIEFLACLSQIYSRNSLRISPRKRICFLKSGKSIYALFAVELRCDFRTHQFHKGPEFL